MKAFLAGLKRWYRRRFRGIVEPPAHARGQGTTWQQQQGTLWLRAGWAEHFQCQCGTHLKFTPEDLKILSQSHIEGCEGIGLQNVPHSRCTCPVDEARYIIHCPTCRIGHWKQARAAESAFRETTL
jgi:hypothetical protein